MSKTLPICTVSQREVQDPIINVDYPEINITCEIFNTSTTNTSFGGHGSSNKHYRNVLIPVMNETTLKRITRTFLESGFTEFLEEAKNSQTKSENPLIASMAEFVFHALGLIDSLKIKVFPHLREQSIESVADYVETRDWMRSSVRCIAWHPDCFKIAVAGADDIIRIYTDEPVPVLKSASQKWISSMAWRPLSAAELAVGCQKGLCLWTITRAGSQVQFLKHPNHCPIISVQWNMDGTLVATASIGDTSVLIWNTDKMQNSPLRRVASPACSLLKWSPDGTYLFSATVGNVFRVWSCDKKWIPERWTLNLGKIKSACWSNCSSFLLFITEEPILYRLQFFEEQLFTKCNLPKQAIPIADLSKISVGHRQVGGQPQQIAWDHSGLYLAIIFKNSPCIVIFSTCIQKFNLSISPLCFIPGKGAVEYPSYITFQSKNRKNSDSVLTIGWSSGRIQFFPFVNM